MSDRTGQAMATAVGQTGDTRSERLRARSAARWPCLTFTVEPAGVPAGEASAVVKGG